jgi:hypothetical protein
VVRCESAEAGALVTSKHVLLGSERGGSDSDVFWKRHTAHSLLILTKSSGRDRGEMSSETMPESGSFRH